MKTWTWSFVVIAIMITIVKPTTARSRTGAGVIKQLFNAALSKRCVTTSCMRYPTCYVGYDTIRTKRGGCRGGKRKKECCKSNLPQCVVTECNPNPSCQRHYRELERTKSGCSDGTVKAYCCKTDDLPLCFAMDCPDKKVVKKMSCPRHYTEKARYLGECGAHGGERVACCKSSFDNWNDGNQTVRYEASSSHAEYFTIFVSNSQSLYGQFFNILLTLPILTSFIKCTSLW